MCCVLGPTAPASSITSESVAPYCMENVNYTHDKEKNNMETNEVEVKFILTKLLPDLGGHPTLA